MSDNPHEHDIAQVILTVGEFETLICSVEHSLRGMIGTETQRVAHKADDQLARQLGRDAFWWKSEQILGRIPQNQHQGWWIATDGPKHAQA